MHSFLRRLKYYAIGFTLGLLFLIFFFKNRGCTWLPAQRVRNSVLERVVVLPDVQEKALHAQGFSRTDVVDIIQDGPIDFSESLKHDDPKVYVFRGQTKTGRLLRLFVTLPSESFVSEIHFNETSIDLVKNSKRGEGAMILFPKKPSLLFLDSAATMHQSIQNMGFKSLNDILHRLKSSGKLNFTQTDFSLKPKALHVISFRDNNGKFSSFKAIWYKEKINILAFGEGQSSPSESLIQ